MAPLILVLVLVGALVGASLVIGAPILAIPIVLLALGAWAGAAFVRRASGRGPAPGEKPEVEFTDRDRETLTPE
jgi:hypothetical protein